MQTQSTTPAQAEPPMRPPAAPAGRSPAVTVALAVGLGLVAAVAGWWVQTSRMPDPAFAYGMKVAVPRTIRPVTLSGADGPVALPYADGKWTLMFFGYTHCPDICPTTMQYLRAEVQAMGSRAERLHVTFVSVDPQRDTPAALARFAHYYHPGFAGVTGEKAALDQLTGDAGAAYFKGAKASRGGSDYDVTHSTSIYVIGPDGKLRAIYGGSGTPGRLAADFAFLGD